MRFSRAAAVLACVLAVTPLAAEEQHALAPLSGAKVISALAEGNRRFTAGHARHPHADRRRIRETDLHGQHPQAVVLTCADSRVSPEVVLDQGIGDLFSIRVAGNVANEDEAASVEYAVEHLGVPVCVVLGHTGCGAVTAVVRGDKLPHSFGHLLSPIRETVRDLRRARPTLQGEALIGEAVQANVWRAVADLLSENDALRDRARTGRLAIVGAVYEIRTGAVRWLGHHPRETVLLDTAAPRIRE